MLRSLVFAACLVSQAIHLPAAGLEDVIPLTKPWLDPRPSERSVPRVEESVRLKMISELHQASSNSGLRLHYGQSSIDILLIDLGDEPTIKEYIERSFGAVHSRGARTVLYASRHPSLIALLEPYLFREESAASFLEECSLRAPRSVDAAFIYQKMIVSCPEFSDLTKAWAAQLRTTRGHASAMREVMRAFWRENEALLKAKNYQAVRPPSKAVVLAPGDQTVPNRSILATALPVAASTNARGLPVVTASGAPPVLRPAGVGIAPVGGIVSLTKPWLEVRSSERSVPQVEENIRLRMIAELTEAKRTPGVAEIYGTTRVDVLLIDLGDTVTMNQYIEEYFGPTQRRGAIDVLSAARQPDLILLLVPFLFRVEPAETKRSDEGSIAPRSVTASRICLHLVRKASGFDESAQNWAVEVQRKSRSEAALRDQVRAFWQENEAHLKAKNYQAVRPPGTAAPGVRGPASVSNHSSTLPARAATLPPRVSTNSLPILTASNSPPSAPPGDVLPLTRRWLDLRPSERGVPQVEEEVRLKMIAELHELNRNPFGKPNYGRPLIDVLLVDLGDVETIDRYVSNQFGPGDRKTASSVLPASKQPIVVARLGASLLREEPINEIVLVPRTVAAAQLCLTLLQRCPEFNQATRRWADQLQSTEKDRATLRSAVRTFWLENEAFLKAKNYQAVRPPSTVGANRP